MGLYSLDPSIAIPNDGDISLGDVNRDGLIDITDAYLIATYSVNPTDPSLPAGIGTPVIVVAEGKMYWVDRITAKIQRANLDGSQVEDLVTTGLLEPTDLALDVAGGKIYWADVVVGGGAKIQRANLDGSQVENLISTGLRDPRGLALDVTGGKIYWADAILGGAKIQRANLDGSRVEALVISELNGLRDLALDLAGGKMYWTKGWFGNRIQRANLDGSQIEDLISTLQGNPGSLVLVLPEGKMYWTNEDWTGASLGKIKRANLDGSQVEDLISTGLRAPRGLALELTDMSPEVTVNRPPVLDGIGKQSVSEGELLHIDLVARDPEGGEVTYEAQSNAPGVATVSVSGREMTISPVELGVATVAVMASDASGATTTRTFTVNVTAPVPESRGKMYWTDAGTDKIQRANLDGTQVEDLVTTGLDFPSGLALDVAGGKMYWIDAGTDKIQRANLDGSQIEDLIFTGLNIPQALALDLDGAKMYWMDPGTIRIQRANLDGSQVEDLVVTGLDYPDGLALDLDGGKMYWTDWGTNKIQRANLDGTRIEDLITGLSDPVGLALDIAVPDAPDLVAASPSVNPPNPASSQSFTLSVAIHNRGNASAPPTTVRYYLSTDSTITTDDPEVGTNAVSGLAAPSSTFKLIRLTAPSNLGTYYYGACVQPVSGESDTQNNCSSASEVVVVAR